MLVNNLGGDTAVEYTQASCSEKWRSVMPADKHVLHVQRMSQRLSHPTTSRSFPRRYMVANNLAGDTAVGYTQAS